MIYRRVTDVTDTPLPINNFECGTEQNRLPLEEDDFNDGVSESLFDHGRIDDSSAIFKRVRLFTRWQDAEDSREPTPRFKFGRVLLWRLCGAAEAVRAQIITLTVDFLKEISPSRDERYWDVAVSVYFIGTCRERAIPTIFLYAKRKKSRQEVVKILRRLDWLAPGKSSLIMTTWHNPIVRKEVIDYFADMGGDRKLLEHVF
jgi:hypothetical protein